MIQVQSICKTFGKLVALDNVNLSFERGHSYALIGPNGSGKTTLIKSILGLVVPTKGVIRFDDEPIGNCWKYREKIGYMPQVGRYPESMRIAEVIDMMKSVRPGTSRYDEELIDEFRLTKLYDKKMHTLSGGTRQKVSAALTFLFGSPVLILDEPTAGLDPISAEILKEKILKEKHKGRLVIITSHILSDLDELTTDIVYLYEGQLQYSNSIETLKAETGEKKLGRAIATFIRQKELLETIN